MCAICWDTTKEIKVEIFPRKNFVTIFSRYMYITALSTVCAVNFICNGFSPSLGNEVSNKPPCEIEVFE